MDVQDVKLIIINAASLTLSFSDYLESGLKILLLMVSIAYTFMKWLELYEKRKRINQAAEAQESGGSSQDENVDK